MADQIRFLFPLWLIFAVLFEILVILLLHVRRHWHDGRG